MNNANNNRMLYISKQEKLEILGAVVDAMQWPTKKMFIVYANTKNELDNLSFTDLETMQSEYYYNFELNQILYN